MEPREFVDTRMKRLMAQTLEDFERDVERPLQAVREMLGENFQARQVTKILNDCDGYKRTFRKKLQAFAGDCTDLMPSDLQVNAFEPIVRS